MDEPGGSRGQEQFPRTESTVTTWNERLSDAASVFQPFKARTGPEIEKQNRPEGTGILADGARFPTLDLTYGLRKTVAGRPATSSPQVLNMAEQRTPAGLEGQQEVMNVVMQVLKENEEADAFLWRNLAFTRKRRDDQLRVVLNKINDEKLETASLLSRERMGLSNIVNSWKQEMILQKQKQDKIVTEMRDERKNSEKLLIQKYENIVKDMQETSRREAELTILVQTHERIVTEMQNLFDEKETALIRQQERTIVGMIDARKEEETAFIQNHEKITAEMNAARMKEEAAKLIQKHEKIVTEMREERKEAESSLTRRHERVVYDMREEHEKSSELVQKQEGTIIKFEEARKDREMLLTREHELVVTEMKDAHVADTRLIQKYEKTIREFEMQEARKKADQIMFTHNYKKLLSAQVDAHRKAEARLYQKQEKQVTELKSAYKEAEKLCIQKYEKIVIEADDARKENEARLLKDHKVEMDAGKEREKEIQQNKRDLEAEVVKFKNMYYMALNSYTVLEKEDGEAMQALHAQLESLQCQLAALKEEETTGEKEHAEEAKRAVSAVPESPESQDSVYKYTYTTVSNKDLELLALQSQLAKLQGDKVELQEALDALRDHQNRRTKSESDKLSIEILWEVAQKVLSFPEDVAEIQTINTSGYETLLSSRKANSVDKMMACVTVALKTAAKNWETAQDEFAKLKLAVGKHIPETIIGRGSGDSYGSEYGSVEEFSQKKRRRLRSLTELKERRSSGQQKGSSRRKRTRPQRFVPGN